METKFHGRRISIDEVIKSINVKLFLDQFFFFRSIFAFLLFLRDSTLLTQKEITQIIER